MTTKPPSNRPEGRYVKFKVTIDGNARTWLPEYVSEDEVLQYLADYTPVYGGNKMFACDIKVSDVELE